MENTNGSTTKDAKLLEDYNKTIKFGCNQCDKVYNQKNHLTRHIKEKHQDIICEFCDRMFSSFQLLDKHCKIDHFGEENLLKCEICHMKFTLKKYLRAHKKRVHAEKKFKCKFKGCKKLFSLPAYMNIHYKQDHLKIKSMIFRKCDICGFKSLQKKGFENHMIGKHLGGFQCEFCDRSFDSHDLFKKHFFKDHSMGELVECEVCHKKFHDRQSLDKHKSLHHKEKKIKCDFENCEKMFRFLSEMRAHYKEIHFKLKRERRFECDFCGFKFFKLTHLKIHLKNMTVHQKIRSKTIQNFKCKSCDYKSTRKDHLKEHMKKMRAPRASKEKEITEIYRLCHENQIRNISVNLQNLTKKYPMNEFVDMDWDIQKPNE